MCIGKVERTLLLRMLSNVPWGITLMTNTAKRLLVDIGELASHVAPRASEIEAARRMPADLVEALRSIGVFRMFVPRSHGGLELDLPRSEEHTSELQSRQYLVCRLLLAKKQHMTRTHVRRSAAV